MKFSVNKHKFMKKMLKKAQIVLCTCIESSSNLLKGLIFPRVIIENSDKISENIIISPILKKCEQLVLCGNSQESSVFTDKIIKLNIQYKTDLSIVKTISQLFGNNIESFQKENSIDLWLYGLKWPNFSEKVLFINVKGKENVVNGSLQNLEYFSFSYLY